MSGSSSRLRHGATLSLVFGAVVATGAATGAWGQENRLHASGRPGAAAVSLPAADPAGAALSAREARRLVVRSGDRWAAYYSPREFEEFSRGLGGRYVGVGLWVRRTADGSVTVSRVQPRAPAARAGIRPGDRLERIDGSPADRLPVTEVVALLRGWAPGSGARVGRGAARAARAGGNGAEPAPGTTVRLSVRHGGRLREVTLRRTVLVARQVRVYHPRPGVSVIRVAGFTEGVGAEVAAAARQAADAMAHAGRRGGVVLDLRGNPGGLLTEAARAADAFLDGGPVATYDVRGTRYRLAAPPGGDTATPLVVLVDAGTMSAAELLAGALQDRGRALVVGSRTFGKGTVQEPSRLADGSVLELTVGRYRTPSGRCPDGTGIEPDVPVPPQAGPAEAQRTALAVLSGLGGG